MAISKKDKKILNQVTDIKNDLKKFEKNMNSITNGLIENLLEIKKNNIPDRFQKLIEEEKKQAAKEKEEFLLIIEKQIREIKKLNKENSIISKFKKIFKRQESTIKTLENENKILKSLLYDVNQVIKDIEIEHDLKEKTLNIQKELLKFKKLELPIQINEDDFEKKVQEAMDRSPLRENIEELKQKELNNELNNEELINIIDKIDKYI